jgi:Flp pilus assembly protein TadD
MLSCRAVLRWYLALALVSVVACSPGPDEAIDVPLPEAAYVGVEVCARCHEAQTELWRGSDHDLAMQEATEETVLGDFSGRELVYGGVTSSFFRRDGKFVVRTDGPDGELRDYAIAYTFGFEPLQQYLVEFPAGRYQAVSLAWDSRPAAEGGQRWFHLYPDEVVDFRDPLHWTKRLQNWNAMCAECHSTNLQKSYQPDGDAGSGRYDTTWYEMNVSCEACHGPGSIHVAWGERDEAERDPGLDNAGLVVNLGDDDAGVWVIDTKTGLAERQPPRSNHRQLETCARCHTRRSSEQADYVFGEPLLDTHRVAMLEEPLYYPDGQILDEVYVYGSFLQSKMYRAGVTCQDCHDPHGLHVRGEGNSVCAGCHAPDKFDTPSHHFHDAGTEGALCVACHMPERTYMVVDPRRDHSFRVPRPDLSDRLGTPNACNSCHQNQTSEWAARAVTRWYGGERPPHYGETLYAGRVGAPGASDALSRLALDLEAPGIVRGTALTLLARQPSARTAETLAATSSSSEPFVRLGALEAVDTLPAEARHRLVVPLLEDPIRNVRLEAGRVLAGVPRVSFSPRQWERLTEVLEEYREAQMRNADWPESWVNLGLLATQLGQPGEAERSYRRAIALDPQFARAYVNLADLYRLLDRDAEGERVLREGLESVWEGQAADLHHGLGLALVRLKRTDEALDELRKAAELRPDEARYSYVYGVALESRGEIERALEVVGAAHERSPYDRDLLYALVSWNIERGARREALKFARELADVARDDPSVSRLLAELESGQ